MSSRLDSQSAEDSITSSNGERDDFTHSQHPQLTPQRDRYMTPYERLTYDLNNDKKVLREVTLGKRIGFYRIRGELGSGNFSQVKLGVQILTREKVAIKILDKTKLDTKTQRLLSREISSMECLHHPNIIRLYEVVETLAKLYLIMEYARDGELFTKVSNEGRIQEADARPLFAQIISAVQHMHENHIIHRDLKAENIFFSNPRVIKVGDFGFSTLASIGQSLNTFCGSPPYAAPELFRDDSYDGVLVDNWALGILLYFMITGILPFRADTVSKLKKCILDGGYTIPSYVSDVCSGVIKGLLKPMPTDRMTIQDLVTCEWLKGEEFIDAMEPLNLFSDREHSDGARECLGLNKSCVLHDDKYGKKVETGVKFTEEELEARKICLELGISEELLGFAKNNASRSGIAGTYHIVLHRIQKRQSDLDNPMPDGRINADMINFGVRNGKENGGMGGVVSRDKKNSKLCIIL